MEIFKTVRSKFARTYYLIALLSVFSLTSCLDEQAEITPEESFVEVASAVAPSSGGSSYLRQQESLGGHTIERHIAKSDAYLRNRLQTSSISAASTFTELNQAGQVIVNALNANSGTISNWLSGSSTSLTLTYTHHKTIGRIMYRSNLYSTTPASRFKVVLRKKSGAPYGYYVLTSYPN